MGSIGDLSLAAADILWEDLHLGDKPFPLEIPTHGSSAEERRKIRGRVYAQLQKRGLAAVDRPTSDLANTLRLLAGPRVSIDLVALRDMAATTPLRAVVAARGGRAVLAVQRDLVISLTEVQGNAIVAAIVDLLPVNRAGPGQRLTVPDAALRAYPASSGRHRARGSGDTGQPPAQGTDDHDGALRSITAIMARPTVRAGAIGVLLGDGRGASRRLPGLSFFDTDQGRYLAAAQHRDGGTWITLSPTDNARLVRHVGSMVLTALQGRA